MAKALVVYHSRSGHTELMAARICEAIRDEGLDVICKKVEEATVDDLLHADGIIIGSPTYYGTMAGEVKRFLDDSVTYHGKLDGKVGAAFSSANSTGQETTVLSILEALLIHGMIVQGDCRGLHYGATTVGEQTDSQLQHCRRFGQRFARLVKTVAASSTNPNSD